MADDLRLGDLGQRAAGSARRRRAGQQRRRRLLGDVELGADERAAARARPSRRSSGAVALQRRLDRRPGGDAACPWRAVGLDAGVAVQAVVVDRAHAATVLARAGHRGAEHLGQPVDVGLRALLGERDEQPVGCSS